MELIMQYAVMQDVMSTLGQGFGLI